MARRLKEKEPEVKEETIEENVEEVNKPVIGVVSNCERLNMRKEASAESEIVSVLNSKTEVNVNLDESNDEFYKVEANNVTGFCMKKFIELK